MMLTLFADASWCPNTKAAGWGAWAIRDGWPKGKFLGGPVNRVVPSSNAAELCGLAAALWQLDRDGDLGGVDTLMLQCDNVFALGYVYSTVTNARVARHKTARQAAIPLAHTDSKLGREALQAIQEVIGKRQVYLRHVKGHNGTDDGRSWVNAKCDEEARRHMRDMRNSRFLEAAE